MVDKAATDRSGAVAMGLSAINTYVGENKVEDYVKYVRADLMGITREDLTYDLGRHVDDSVHLFEEWGLPIWKKGDDGFSLDGFQARDAGKKIPQGRRHAGALGQVADHDQRRVLQGHRGRGRQEGARAQPQATERRPEPLRARLHREALPRRQRPEAGRGRGRLLGAREQDLHLQGQGDDQRRRRRGQLLPAPLHQGGPGPRLVPRLERRFRVRARHAGRRRDDPDGEPLRARALQGRLRAGRRLVPLLQGEGHQRPR